MKYDVRAELHCHSNTDGTTIPYAKFIYDSVQSVEQILDQAVKLKIKFLAITDHNSLAGYRKAKKIITKNKLLIKLIPGMEISTKQGHILAYNITKQIPPRLSAAKTIDQIHQQGGWAVAAHPGYTFQSLKNKVKELPLDGLEGFNAYITKAANRKSLRLVKKTGLPMTVGSDSHEVETIGKAMMLFSEKIKSVAQMFAAIKKKDYQFSLSKINRTASVIKHVRSSLKIKKSKRH